ncbi:MAG: hypothetical protein FD129_480, partial [bacterium]
MMSRPRLIALLLASVVPLLDPPLHLLSSVARAGAADPASPPIPLGRAELGRDAVLFSSSGDIWITGPGGGVARRLTSGPAWDDLPLLSPDETTIAFARSFDGEKDLYTLPIQGGEPTRLTWHPKGDFPRDWSPDGREILFSSSRTGDGLDRLYAIAATGGTERALDLPSGSQASWSPDGRRLALTLGPKFGGWLRYRGGNVPRIQVVDLETGRVESLPAQTYADWQPMWIGDDIWFLSERDGVANLFHWRPGTSTVEAVTHFEKFGVESASAGPGAIVLVVQGRLWRCDLDSGALVAIDVNRPEEERPGPATAIESVADFADEYLITPDGRQLLVTARGDLFSVDCRTGRAMNLTDSPGVADRRPAMSPDKSSLAWFSDDSGEYRLQVARLSADGLPHLPATVITIGESPTFYSAPTWSPDSRHLVVSDVRRRL